MKNSEDAIGKVLAGLRDAEASAGMERRILHGLEERAAVGSGHRTGAGWRGWLPVWLVGPGRVVGVGSLVCGVALAGVVAVGLGVSAVRRLGRAPASTRTGIASSGPMALGAWEVAGESAGPASASSRAGLRALTGRKLGRKTNAEGGVDRDAVAVEAMHAASYPAPPMPLTEQEKLLLRLVHKDDPVELAMLDPKVRALQELEDKAEFQRFFGQSAKQAATEQPGMEEGVPQQSTAEQALPEQSAPEQSVPEQPAQPPSVPENVGPDQSTTQHAEPRATRTTGENE
ncbi:MAG TPA: hypothetical protein VHS13_09110 [Edaphobacter sp.]|nr:hypothetical protein [Edaphobacter sp.]